MFGWSYYFYELENKAISVFYAGVSAIYKSRVICAAGRWQRASDETHETRGSIT